MSTILIAEDETIIRDELASTLSDEGYRVLTAPNGEAALAILNSQSVQLMITDLRMPRMDGQELMRHARVSSPETVFVVMTAFGSMETAIEALRAGAADYLIKPLAMEEVLSKVQRILGNLDLQASNRMLRRDLDRKVGPLDMVGTSGALEKIRTLIQKVAPTRSNVLITGESGTGKELIARAIHSQGSTKNEPFVAVNCAAIPENLIESELFGHQKGSFTGAVADSEGLFRSARKGTLFLDEIGELPLALQAKLLRVLEEKMIHPVGSSRFVPFEARVIAATNRDLRAEVAEKRFREDLFFRLAIMELHSPALRERAEDIPQLVQYFLKRINRDLRRNYTGVDDVAMERLKRAAWKGNIRELQNVMERAMIVGEEPMLKECDLSLNGGASFSVGHARELKDAVRQFELIHIGNILKEVKGDKRAAAKVLGISLSSLYRHLDEPEEQ